MDNDSPPSANPNVESPGRDTRAISDPSNDDPVGLIVDDKAYAIHPARHACPDPVYPVTTEEINALATMSLLPDSDNFEYTDEDFGTTYSIRHDSSNTALLSQTDDPDEPYFFDPIDYAFDPIVRRDQGSREFGKAVYLTVKTGKHTDKFVRDSDLDSFLHQLSDEQLLGRGIDRKDPEYYIRQAMRMQGQLRKIQQEQDLTLLDEAFHECHEDVHDDANTDDFDDDMHSTEMPGLLSRPSIDEVDRAARPAFKVEPAKTDFAAIRPYLGFQSLETIKKTIENTTQMAKTILRFPLRCHIKARNPHLNRRRLNEKVSTDPVFSSHADVTGYSCCQVFYGMASQMINIYGMDSKGQFPDVYRRFLQEEGAPLALRRDNAKEEKSWTVIDINRKNATKDEYSQDYNQQQNPVEGHAIRWLKDHTKILMDRTGAPPDVWLQAFMYLADIHNVSANDALRGQTPIAARHGNTPDISAFLQYVFWEKVLFRQQVSFPNSNERAGFFIGIAHNTGDMMTFKVLDADTGEIICVTDLHSAEDRMNPNKRVRFGEPVPVLPNEAESTTHDDLEPAAALDPTTDLTTTPSLDYSNEPFATVVKPKSKPPRPKKRKDSLMPAMFKGSNLKRQARRRLTRSTYRKRQKASKDEADPFQLSAPGYDSVTRKPGQKYPIGLTIKKRFHGQLYEGRVTSYSPRERYYYVLYSDGDTEELDEREVEMFAIFPEPTTPTPDNRGASDASSTDQDRGDVNATPPATSGETTVDLDSTPSKVRGDNNGTTSLPIDLETATNTPAAAARVDSTTEYVNPYKRYWLSNRGITAMALATLTLPSCPAPTHAWGRIVDTHPTVPFVPTPSDIESDAIGQEYKINNLSTMEANILMYNQHVDMLQTEFEMNNDFDVTDEYFSMMAITEHRVTGRGTEDEQVRLKVRTLDNTEQYYPMEVLRIEYPYLVAEYAIRNHLHNTPKFEWTRDYADNHGELSRMVMHAKTLGRQPKLKFGIQVPQSVKQAYMLDKLNQNRKWEEATMKELKQIKDYETFRVLEDDEPMPEGYKLIPYHIVYDAKFDLRCKARLVAGGNFTDPPKEDTYSGVVATETVRSVMMLADMNKLNVCAADIGNAFLYGRTREKVYVIAGPEFGKDEGKRMIIEKGLYGLRTSGARFHETLAAKLRDMGFFPSKADEDLWMRSQGDHWEYIAVYVDDLLVFSRDPQPIMEHLQQSFILKGVGEPEYFLGADIQTLNQAWQQYDVKTAMSSETYIERMIQKFEAMEGGRKFVHASIPMNNEYHPELDDSPFLNALDATKFRGMIGSCNWLITLGRFDIHYAVNSLSRYSMQPREGHLKCMRQVIGYLAGHRDGRIVMDHTPMRRVTSDDKSDDEYFKPWENAYPTASEDVPRDLLPEAKGRSVNISCFVDADHARDQVTRKSVSGVIMFLNSTPIAWISKRQNTCETSTYGSEMVAARIAAEKIMEIRWNLRALGVPIDGPAMMYGDNKSVILSTTMPSSVLKKKHLACNYFRIRESIASRIIRFEYVKSARNYADVMTKPLAKHEFQTLVKPMLFRVNPKQRTDSMELVPTRIPTETNDDPEFDKNQCETKSGAPLSPFPKPIAADPERPPIAAE